MRPPSGRPPRRRRLTAADWADARTGLDLVKGKWVLAIAAELSKRPRRYRELLHDLDGERGIPDKTLTETLKRMQEDGLATQKLLRVDSNKANTVYALTPLGRSLLELVAAVADWTRRHAGKLPDRMHPRPAPRSPR